MEDVRSNMFQVPSTPILFLLTIESLPIDGAIAAMSFCCWFSPLYVCFARSGCDQRLWEASMNVISDTCAQPLTPSRSPFKDSRP